MSKKLAGQVAVVTGASKGIGAEIALRLADEGASIVVNYSSSKEGAEKVVNEIVKKGGKAVAIKGDISKPEEVKSFFKEAAKAFNKIDILVNNAGVYEFQPLESITPEHFYKQFDLNVLGLILASQEAIKYIGPAGGSIINISSLASTAGLPQSAVYGATKASVDAVTRALSKELGPRKIRVNSINPGLVVTEGVNAAGFSEGDFRQHYEQQTSLGRVGVPADIAPAVVFLVSPDASWITGETLYITGGAR